MFKTSSLFILFIALSQTHCSLQQSQGRKCLEEINAGCSLTSKQAAEAINEKGTEHCNFSPSETDFWKQNILQEASLINPSFSAWIGESPEETPKQYLNIQHQNYSDSCLFSIPQEQDIDIKKYLDLSLKLLENS